MNTQYCPRCDKLFTDKTKVLAWAKVVAHIKKAHPAYLPMVEE